MKDFARSDDPAVQGQLDRLAKLSLPQGRLGLETIRSLLARLDNPQDRLPPVFHVSGTNGKGSTCTYLRYILEADGMAVHTATKPHLVRYNERIRIAGNLISNAELAALLCEVLDAGEDLSPSFFEVTTAATFLAFARHPADACIIEVGLGGRFDATNVIEHPTVCGIASLGLDHESFLLAPEEGTPSEPLARIAFEKAGIARAGVPLVTQSYTTAAALAVTQTANRVGARLKMRGYEWDARAGDDGLEYSDKAGALSLPLPALRGAHQADNAALAIAMLRHQDSVVVSDAAMRQGLRIAKWPARLQRLSHGPLAALVPGHELWLDGGHNPDAGTAIARHFTGPVHLVIGMLVNKDPGAIVKPLAGRLASLTVVPIPGSEAHKAAAFGPDAVAAESVSDALTAIGSDDAPVLIAGSLYLAGEVLRLNGELPD